jgi:hypothetical protein
VQGCRSRCCGGLVSEPHRDDSDVDSSQEEVHGDRWPQVCIVTCLPASDGALVAAVVRCLTSRCSSGVAGELLRTVRGTVRPGMGGALDEVGVTSHVMDPRAGPAVGVSPPAEAIRAKQASMVEAAVAGATGGHEQRSVGIRPGPSPGRQMAIEHQLVGAGRMQRDEPAGRRSCSCRSAPH